MRQEWVLQVPLWVVGWQCRAQPMEMPFPCVGMSSCFEPGDTSPKHACNMTQSMLVGSAAPHEQLWSLAMQNRD